MSSVGRSENIDMDFTIPNILAVFIEVHDPAHLPLFEDRKWKESVVFNRAQTDGDEPLPD